MDAHIHTAITGPRAAHYNGKYGEDGIEVHTEIAEAWLHFQWRNNDANKQNRPSYYYISSPRRISTIWSDMTREQASVSVSPTSSTTIAS